MATRKARKAPTAVTLPPEPRSVYEKLRDGDYKNKLPYPEMVGRRVAGGELPSHQEERAKMLVAYREEESRIAEEFKADALAEVGLTGHPKADKVYSLAWEYGHSAGLSEVMNYLPELAELAK